MAGILISQFEIADLPSAFYFGLRVAVAIGAAILGWFLAGPVARVLHRLAFQKPISPKGLFASRLIAAIVLALLAFLLIPIGPGMGFGLGGSGTGTNGGDGQKNGGPGPG